MVPKTSNNDAESYYQSEICGLGASSRAHLSCLPNESVLLAGESTVTLDSCGNHHVIVNI